MEPVRVTATPEEERDVAFTPDGESIFFVSDKDGQGDIWRAQRAESKKFWWQNSEFKLDRLTRDSDVESGLKVSPEGYRFGILHLKLYHQLYAPLVAALRAPESADNIVLSSRQTKLDRLYKKVDEAIAQLAKQVGIAA